MRMASVAAANAAEVRASVFSARSIVEVDLRERRRQLVDLPAGRHHRRGHLADLLRVRSPFGQVVDELAARSASGARISLKHPAVVVEQGVYLVDLGLGRGETSVNICSDAPHRGGRAPQEA